MMCDTFVAVPAATADGSLIFGKNSDREPNEAQALEYYPGRNYAGSDKVQCSYMEIPQVKETHPVLLSRPFWMWGAEMGANEKGVVIGNEAVWSRIPVNKDDALTGMDLLRLALERASHAAAAMETIVRLLADFGQGGRCGYEDRHIAYHNSFIIADPKEAWVLETAGPFWAALKVKDVYTISNGLTIGETFDECHPELISTARKRGWLKKGEDFHFARSYSDWLFTTFSASRTRQNRSFQLLREKEGNIGIDDALRMLRDHGGDGYCPDTHLLGNRICAHAANRIFRNATQTVGSLAAHLKPDRQTYWVTGTSSPCIGIFKPVWFTGRVLPDIGPAPGGIFDADTLWWAHERLHRLVLVDFMKRHEYIRDRRRFLETSFSGQADSVNPDDSLEVTKKAFQQACEKTAEWADQVGDMTVQRRAGWFYRRYWAVQNRKAKMNTG